METKIVKIKRKIVQDYPVYLGLSWGVLMFVSLDLIVPYFKGEIYTLNKLLIGLAVYVFIGVVFGWLIKSAQGNSN